MEMKYVSTRGKAEAVEAAQAILQGIAGDGGLFVPTEIPKTDAEFVQGLTELSYEELAFEILKLYLTDYPEEELKELLPRETLLAVLNVNQVPEAKQQALLDALDAANAVPELVELAHIMAQDAVRGLVRCHAVEFYQPLPDCLTGFAREAYAFLYTQLCVLEGRKALRARGIPEKYDEDIPERMTRKQLKK